MADTSAVPDRSPPSETLRALRDQYTEKLHHVLVRFAEQRARMVRNVGRPCPPPADYANELVHDAHADTWSGVLTWEPARCPLLLHMKRAIQSRTWAEIKLGPRFRSLEILPANDDGERIDLDEEQIVAGLTAKSGILGMFVFPALVARVCLALRHAATDHARVALLRAWERGFTERDEILELTGLDEDEYKRAKDALFYASRDLPPELRKLVQDFLRSAS